MKKILIYVWALSFLACSPENETETSKRPIFDSLTIDYTDGFDNWSEQYSYSSEGQLLNVETRHSTYELVYASDRLAKVLEYQGPNTELSVMDSLIYNPSGTLHSIERYSSYPGPGLSLVWVFTYGYNSDNKVRQKTTYFERGEETTSTELYFWSGNNIEQMERYDGSGELMHEFFYTYDDQENYTENFPIHLHDPIFWGANNVTGYNYIDHTGLLDLACGPCGFTFQYDSDGRPSEIETNWNLIMTFEYQ